MSRLEEIKQQYADEIGIGSYGIIYWRFEYQLINLSEFLKHEKNIIERYAKDVANESLKKVKPLIIVKELNSEPFKGTFYSSPDVQITVDKESITNENNIVLL